jgi:hypothetical protein
MRRPPAWVVVVGVVAAGAWHPAPARADDGFWVSVAAGAAGAADPAEYGDFLFDSPHAPPVAVTRFTGTGRALAMTAGGSTFFTGAATPILLPTSDGYATITNPDVANGSGGLPRFAGGAQASGAPKDAPAVPPDSNQLAVDFAEPAADGSKALTVTATDPSGAVLGRAEVTVRDGDWWVIGLGPGKGDMTPAPVDPLPVEPDGGNGSTGGGVIVTPVIVPVAGGGAVTTPEPGTAALLGLGGLAAAGWRRVRRK